MSGLMSDNWLYDSSPGKLGTSKSGGPFLPDTIARVWLNANRSPNHDPEMYRLDPCGKLIRRDLYGDYSEMGWEIDHIKPVFHGGTDDIWNLQAMHWHNNRVKSDTWPWSPSDCSKY
ncbi:HNH endonuclease [Desulfocurvibacter africanus]|uniref:HNH endonuclease n=1 Tax=Desulfocurvibacter africanus TaxID=873 RepID=UPI000418B212|nr:HNH endonuclease signature motif containing protein [Desulfocurvibacter africanus]